ncbi:MAG: OmpA family protein [Ignavibacteriae bacterium]|nr:OmpA family protein [Ignavibacteriota bacterium]
MKIKKLIFILFFLLLATNFAQFHDYSVKYGMQGHFLVQNTDFDNELYRYSYQARGFLRFEIISNIEAEFGVGIGKINAFDHLKHLWTTSIIPADLRFIFAPFRGEKLNPYVYAGVGILQWNVEDEPASISPEITEKSGWTQFVPIGGGVELAISDDIIMDFSAGYNMTFTDDLNYYNNGENNDGYFDFGVGLTFVTGSGNTDKDSDGLTENEEKQIGTNPKIADTDGDGLHDGDEILKYKTDPLALDSDMDGLNDSEEAINCNTDPNSVDTDGDELSDFVEVKKYDSDPNKKDTDDDKLSDGYEVNKYKTNPIKKDTDDDGLDDFVELDKYKTNPSNADTDGDGLNDGKEVGKFNSNPNKKDTDDGGTNDLLEFARKTDPNNPDDDIDETQILDVTKPIVLEGVTFSNNKAIINPTSEFILNKAYNTLVAYPNLKIEIQGYTDNIGRAISNQNLSQERADAVKVWLVKKGIVNTRLTAKGYGESNPIANNNTEEGRQKNRRISFLKISE